MDLRMEFCAADKDDLYLDLAVHMGLRRNLCHFGMFDEEQCRKAIKILEWDLQ